VVSEPHASGDSAGQSKGRQEILTAASLIHKRA
jgi:hypothetical protein